MPVPQPRLVEIRSFPDPRGKLGVLEGDELPFVFQRLYYLHGVPKGAIRGEHGHKLLEQFIICMHGVCDIVLDNGTRQFEFRLDQPSLGLYVPPGMWRSLNFLEDNTVCCVLASRPFEREDYIHDLVEFRKWANSRTDDDN